VIFDPATLATIQEAIDRDDLTLLQSFIHPSPPRPKKPRPIRSALMVSAHKARHLNKLDELEADIAIINLEDGVPPQRKRAALYAAMAFIAHAPQEAPLLVVRVNPLDQGGAREIEELNRVHPDAIRIPKVRTQGEIDRASALIDEGIDLHISVETKEAFRDLASFHGAKLKACYLGILDLLVDLGIPQSILKIANPTIDQILTRFLLDAKSQGLLPISFVYQDYQDLEGFRQWCSYEYAMGYRAKGCISPAQVTIANEIFTPPPSQLQRARYIKERYEAMAAQGVGGFVDERYGFIDEPIYKDALNILGEYR